MWLAWLASRPLRGSKYYRLLLIYPYALSAGHCRHLWLFLFNPEIGVVNHVLGSICSTCARAGWTTPCWPSGWWCWPPSGRGWRTTSCFIWRPSRISREVSEAAAIDGATSAQSFWQVTFPLLSPMTFFLVFTKSSPPCLTASPDRYPDARRAGVRPNAASPPSWFISCTRTASVNFKTGVAASQAALMLLLVALYYRDAVSATATGGYTMAGKRAVSVAAVGQAPTGPEPRRGPLLDSRGLDPGHPHHRLAAAVRPDQGHPGVIR